MLVVNKNVQKSGREHLIHLINWHQGGHTCISDHCVHELDALWALEAAWFFLYLFFKFLCCISSKLLLFFFCGSAGWSIWTFIRRSIEFIPFTAAIEGIRSWSASMIDPPYHQFRALPLSFFDIEILLMNFFKIIWHNLQATRSFEHKLIIMIASMKIVFDHLLTNIPVFVTFFCARLVICLFLGSGIFFSLDRLLWIRR